MESEARNTGIERFPIHQSGLVLEERNLDSRDCRRSMWLHGTESSPGPDVSSLLNVVHQLRVRAGATLASISMAAEVRQRSESNWDHCGVIAARGVPGRIRQLHALVRQQAVKRVLESGRASLSASATKSTGRNRSEVLCFSRVWRLRQCINPWLAWSRLARATSSIALVWSWKFETPSLNDFRSIRAVFLLEERNLDSRNHRRSVWLHGIEQSPSPDVSSLLNVVHQLRGRAGATLAVISIRRSPSAF